MGAKEGMTRRPAYRKMCCLQNCWLVLLALLAWTAAAQVQDTNSTTGAAGKTAAETPGTPSQAAKSATETKPELSSKDTTTTFKLHVNLVQVKVVVRDSKGNLIDNLHRDDFELYDQGKLQAISTFGVETAESRRKRAEEAAKTQAADQAMEGSTEKAELPQRFVGVVFDDIHLKMEDVAFARTSMKKLIDSLAPTDRMGIYSTSEQVRQEFTSDKAVLEKTLLSLVPRPKMGNMNMSITCPDVTYYMADQYLNKNNGQVLAIVTAEMAQCLPNQSGQVSSISQSEALTALNQALMAGDADNEFTYRALEDVIRRMAGMPGERVMVLASPGFILASLYLDEMGIIDRANRASIVINTVDARGLYTPDLGADIASSHPDNPQFAGFMNSYRTSEQFENQFVLSDFANGTGGTFFHNSNDLETGLKLAGAAPEVSYVLGFSPQNQKMDGKYHTIKVAITGKRKYDIQARRGYYAPRKANDPQEQAKAEIQEAVFSQDEIQELPLELQTQYFKTGDADAHLSVVSHIDVKGMHFRKAEGRNFDNLTIATVIFDDNGNYVNGTEKFLEMRLLDTTYDKMSRTGLTTKASFDLKPGKYMVRQVIRDSEGAQMAAKNGTVVIPW